MKFRKKSVPFAPKPGISGIFGRMESAPKYRPCRDRAEKRLRMRHLRAVGGVGGSSAGKSRLEQQISNVKSIVER